jgi:hypothetical protein
MRTTTTITIRDNGARRGAGGACRGRAVRAEFGAERDGHVAGRLYLCLPDDEESWIAGSFDVPVE